ncbi:MAG: hypothetical protein M1818_007622 [Claussenomyces sp. TS43310]|nr:MAG: hypothetical protein M1818_007622 [Claussenomyces sp. TS43310]
MENETHSGAKRKRSPSDAVGSQPLQRSPAPANNVTQINYLVKTRSDKLKLVESDPDIFSHVLSLIDDYEGKLQSHVIRMSSNSMTGVLVRHESLAANLGAKLVGPLLVKSFEKIFEGPVKILQMPYGAESISITWLDILEFARTKSNEFVLSDADDGPRVCHFWTKQCHVQISEDDYRLILSGAPMRMIPEQPIAEDELAEIGAIEILEQRLAMLIKKADLVAGRARQLNYHLKVRRTAINNGRASLLRSTEQSGSQSSTMASSFQPVNSRTSGNGDSSALHQDLLRQFMMDDILKRTSSTPARARPPQAPHETVHRNSDVDGQHQTPDASRLSSQPHSSTEDAPVGSYRPLMTARIEKLNRGDTIWPPCDRCKRIQVPCTKHLTACSGCTKKHARCGWKELTAEELAYLGQMPEDSANLDDEDDRNSSRPKSTNPAATRSASPPDPGLRSNRVAVRIGGSMLASRDSSNTDEHHGRDDRGQVDNAISDHGSLSQIAATATLQRER